MDSHTALKAAPPSDRMTVRVGYSPPFFMHEWLTIARSHQTVNLDLLWRRWGLNSLLMHQFMLIYRKDVMLAVSESLVLLGKGNIAKVRNQLVHAIALLDQWEIDRPEKKSAEQQESSQLHEQLKEQQTV